MPKRTTSYRDRLLQRLSSPEEAAHYLNAAFDDSTEVFLEALRDVAQARQMSAVANQAGVKRETIYRAFSKTGNPTLVTLNSVLGVCGLQINIATQGGRSRAASSSPATALSRYAASRGTGRRRRITRETAGQMKFAFGSTTAANIERGAASQINYSLAVPTATYTYVGTGDLQTTARLNLNPIHVKQEQEVPTDLLVATSSGALNSGQIWKEA